MIHVRQHFVAILGDDSLSWDLEQKMSDNIITKALQQDTGRIIVDTEQFQE